MINVHRNPRVAQVGNRVDPTVVRPKVRVAVAPCLACAASSKVAKHTHA
jgi:hypothetical protein